MSFINYATREINLKIVYYGPGLGGKTTNLKYIYSKINSNRKGRLITLSTEVDRTLFFDFLPLNLGEIRGFKTRFQLYTVPGQIFYDASRRLILHDVDGLIFVADSQRSIETENIQSLENLKENLKSYNLYFSQIPYVMQYNKRDLPDLVPIEELQDNLNPDRAPYFEAAAIQGIGVFETLREICKLVVRTV